MMLIPCGGATSGSWGPLGALLKTQSTKGRTMDNQGLGDTPPTKAAPMAQEEPEEQLKGGPQPSGCDG